MPAPTITALPTAPSRADDPELFSSKADAFLGALPTFGTQANAQASYNDGVATAVTASQTAAATSATNAGTSATNAAASATTASGHATTASTQATNAAASATAAALSYDSFDDRYLGAKAANPTLDNDGAALLTGALYWNTAANEMRVYTGSAWVTAYNTGSYAPLASPAFTGVPTAPTAAVDTNTTQLATTAFVVGQAANAAPLMNGTAAVGTSLEYARENHVHPSDTSRAALASPTFTGTPLSTTAVVDTNTTQIATTAFVIAQASGVVGSTPSTAAVGVSTRFARADHVHPVQTTVSGSSGSCTGNAATATTAAACSGNSATATTAAACSGNSATATTATTATTANGLNTANNYQVNSLGVGTAASATAGEIRATNNVTAFYSSDKRLKENVQPITNALELVSAIGGKTFDWTDAYILEHGGEDGFFVRKSDFGVIAQDVQDVFPMAVREREDGTLAVDYPKLVAIAFQAIAELRAEVEALKNDA